MGERKEVSLKVLYKNTKNTMSKKKKKQAVDRKSVASYLTISKTYADDFTKTAHKFMQLIGLQAEDYNILSKRTKQYLMRLKHTPYRIYAEKGSPVPKAYIKFFNQTMSISERQMFYGDPKYNISFMEYITYGLTLIFAIRNYDQRERDINRDQFELLEKIRVPLLQYTSTHENEAYVVRANEIMKYLFLYVSQPNYRYYTCREEAVANPEKVRIENHIYVSSIEPERKNFMVNGNNRSSYQLRVFNLAHEAGNLLPIAAQIPISLLEAENTNQLINLAKTNITAPVYIQSHAINRLHERMDCKDNIYQNLIYTISFLIPKVITAVNGQRLICALDLTGNVVGYFPFMKQDGAVLLLSFLPLSSPITPEGSILHQELGIELEDSKYIGLDKLSFYTKTDFDSVPQFKHALKKAGMWHLTEIPTETPTEKKEDRILKNFFLMNNIETQQTLEVDL